MRRLLTPVLLVAVGVAVAAPVPKDIEPPAKRLERLFGKAFQPGGTKVEIDREVLKVGVPELPAGRPGEADVPDSPRTERAVTGDFELTVRVTVATPKDVPVDAWAGVHIGFNEKDHFDYMRWLNTGGDKGPNRGVWSQVRRAPRGQSNVTGHAERDAPTATLRVVRKGDQLTAHTRYDTAEWGQEVTVSVDLPKEVRVGVYVGGRKGPFTAEFEKFTVTPLK